MTEESSADECANTLEETSPVISLPPKCPVTSTSESCHQVNGNILHKAPKSGDKSKSKKKPKKSSSSLFTKMFEANAKLKDPMDSPYSDIDSVPQIRRCSKGGDQPTENPTTDHHSKQTTSPNEKEMKKNNDVQGGLWFSKSGKCPANGVLSRAGLKSVNCSFGKVSCKMKMQETVNTKLKDNEEAEDLSITTTSTPEDQSDPKKPLDRNAASLPASNRLMTRALRALEDAKLKVQSSQHQDPTANTSDVPVIRCPERKKAKVKTSLKKAADLSHEDVQASDINSHSLEMPDLKEENETNAVKSDEAHSENLETAIRDSLECKQDNEVSDEPVCSTAYPFQINLTQFVDMKEITFKSLEGEIDGQSVTFQPDANYKFSTYLMMLKDIHDSREKAGQPLVVEPLPSKMLMKDEPALILKNDIKHETKHSSSVSFKNCQRDKSRFKSKTKSPNKKLASNKDTNLFQDEVTKSFVPLNLPKSDRKPSKKSQPVVKKKVNNIHSSSEQSMSLSDWSRLQELQENTFLGSVPKKRWQRFDHNDEKMLHTQVISLNEQPQIPPIKQKSGPTCGSEQIASPATETGPEKTTEATNSSCEVPSSPKGKMIPAATVLGLVLFLSPCTDSNQTGWK